MKRLLLSHKLTAVLLLVIVVLAVGVLFYHRVEHLRALDALYLSVITLTTVGYGDFSPHTDAGKMFTIVYLFVGIGVLLAFMAVITEHVIANSRRVTEAYLSKAEKRVDSILKETLRKKM